MLGTLGTCSTAVKMTLFCNYTDGNCFGNIKFRKKWLPTQFRKLSHNKSDKLPPVEKTLISKKGSDKKAKDKPLEEVEPSTTASQIELEAEEEPTIELPPPMKPIQDTTTALSGTPSSTLSSAEDQTCTSAKITKALSLKSLEEPPAAVNQTADVAEIERIVKEKMQSFKYLENDAAITSNSIAEGGSSSSMGGIGLDDPTIGVPSVSNGGGGSSCAASAVSGSGATFNKAPTSPHYIAEIRNPSSSVPIPDDLKGGKERMVFGNIEAIYEWHRDHFLKSLQKCQQNPHELGPLIKRSERKLHMYVVYCQNKPVSEHIVQEHMSYFDELRLKLKYKLCLGDMLIKPVQRIMKYELLLKDILKHTQRAGLTEEIPGLKDAMHIMRVVPKAANDMMDVGRLQKFEGKITAQGKLLLHGPLYCVEGASGSDKNSYNAQKPKELHVFLFEQNIIFAEIVGKKTQFTSPSYIYKAHIQVNKMTLQDLSDQTNGNRFSLCSIDPQRSSLSFICTAPTIELHNEWLNTIRNILQTQNDFLKAIQSPIAYQKELTKDS
ncbi:hypothetical protein RP20_CCG009510 [Aedes albopictus]|nr:hypothetical protein RP20_CCG009510 [Aedes albopictus]